MCVNARFLECETVLLRRFYLRIDAEAAAAVLIEQGIAATVTNPPHRPMTPLDEKHLGFALHVVDPAEKAAALAVLKAFEAEAKEFERDWEGGAETPDLSLLPASIDIPCPACQFNLRGLEPIDVCPACGEAYDAVEIVVQRHGPEALAPAFESAVENTAPLSDDAARRLYVECPACRYVLEGLPQRGTCPECGRDFDKVVILRGGK